MQSIDSIDTNLIILTALSPHKRCKQQAWFLQAKRYNQVSQMIPSSVSKQTNNESDIVCALKSVGADIGDI
jgi:hypothetical protein